MTEESAVKVCVRVRPLIKREDSETSEHVQLFWRADKQAIHQIDDDGNQTKSFSFDRVFSAEETTGQLYQDIAKPLVVSAVEGYNGTIFAYGQTSSGKTFTMMGSEHNPGVIPLAMADVFKTIKNCPKKEFLLRVSYMEIYNETVTDLLCDSWKRKPLEIREGNYKNVYVADLTEEMVTSPEQVLSWITKGEKNRHYGKTKMNQRSSRSHTIFRMILESRERSDPASGENAEGAIIVSHLNLVDLAGAERASQTGAEGARFKEGCNINRSLFTLGQVIKKLSDESQKGFLNYRDSKLTRILQNSLGGNAKTVIICTITPATVDETVSTLQFASAAKRMKNDPHVTEVSDEGALLRRYRNEIVDLKRRLQEVSSVTQTTATERQSLCQLLQEKDQLQREQEDRIKNLTKLLVTASNVAIIPKLPKRRVTWGGKLLRSARLLNEAHWSGDMSFAEPYIKKRRADFTLQDGDEMDEFDSRFDFTALDEQSVDMEMSSITVRTSSEGSQFIDSPRASELMLKVASLESQLEAETQSRQRAEERSSELQKNVSELEKKLEAQVQPSDEEMKSSYELQISELEKKLEMMEAQVQPSGEEMKSSYELQISELEKKLEMMEAQVKPSGEEMNGCYELEKQMVALQHQLQTEAEQRQMAEEKISSLELHVAELEKPSEALARSQHTCEQLRRDLEEAIQICETVGFEKDAIIAERDLIKHTLEHLSKDLETLKEENNSLQKDKDTLQKDIEERKDADEFEKLEQESKREYERELEAEISRLQEATKQSEDTIQKLEADLVKMSSELKKKTQLTTELQSFSGKDLVQEVTQLRRSLDDAECLSLETKKEWAFLHSENISLKERDVTLTADHEKMGSEVKTLQDKLEQEKSRFKKMQTDLQKELMGAFDENTKLTSLLDGKVPKVDLTDNFVLEKSVSELGKELDQSRQRERSLQSEVEALPAKVDELLQQVCGLTEELCSVRDERDRLISAQSSLTEDHQRLKDETSKAEDQLLKMENDLIDAQLKETELTEQLQKIQTDLQHLTQENGILMRSLEDATQKSVQLSEELESVRGERDVLLSEKTEDLQKDPDELQNLHHTISSITEERDQLQEILQAIREERDQLKTDMEENVEMMIESQSELRDAQEKVKDLQSKIHNLESQRAKMDGQHDDDQRSDKDGQLEKLQDQIKQLEEQLGAAAVEKDHLLSERSEHLEALERIQMSIMSLTEERDQLHERLQQLETHLDEKSEMMLPAESELKEQQQQHLISQRHDSTEQNDAPFQQIQTLKEELETLTEEKNHLSLNLQETSQQVCGLTEELCSVRDERDRLISAQSSLTEDHQRLKDETSKAEDQLLKMENDLIDAQLKETELTEQLQKIQTDLQHLTQENGTLMRSLEDATQKSVQLSEELESVCGERDVLLSEKTEDLQKDPDELQNLHHTISSITEERDQLQEILQAIREERDQLKTDLEESNGMLMQVQHEHISPQLQTDRTQDDELLLQIKQLKDELNGVNEEKLQLKSDLQENIEMMIELQEELRGALEKVKDLQNTILELESKHQNSEKTSLHQIQDLQDQMKLLQEELASVCSERQRLLSERNMSSLDETATKMKADITSLTEDRDQLQEILQGIREEREQLRRHLEEKEEMMEQIREKLQSACAERDHLSSERSREMEEMNSRMSLVTEERDQLLETLQGLEEEREKLMTDQQLQDETLSQLREQLQSVCAERDHLLCEKSMSDLEDMQTSLANISEERQQLLEILQTNRQEKNLLRKDLDEKEELMLQLREELQLSCSEKEQLLTERSRELQEKSAEMEMAAANITALTEERDQLLEKLQALREETDQLKRDQHEKDQMMVQLRQDLQAACAERDRRLAEKETDSACNLSNASSSMTSLSDGGDLQEILQGLRELIQVQGELKQKRLVSDPLSPTEKQKAQLQQIQALGVEMESMRNERVLLRKDLQEAADTSKTYQELLHVTKEELKQQQKVNADLMTQSAAKESQLQQQVIKFREIFWLWELYRDQHNSEIQNLQSNLTSLTKDKDELQDMLERAREEGDLLRHDLQKSEETRNQLIVELESLGGLKEQLENEKTRTEQIMDTLRVITEERDRLKQELEGKMEVIAHCESKAGELEKQKILLESEVHSLSQSLTEINCSISSGMDQTNIQTKQRSKDIIAEIDRSNEKLQAAFTKLQLIINHPNEHLDDVTRDEWTAIYHLLPFVPKSERKVHANFTMKTTELNDNLHLTAEAYKKFAERYKSHFETQVQRDVASFEESRLQDLLILMTQNPSQSLRSLQEDFQQLWDQRLSHLLDRRQHYLQKMASVVTVLEDGLSKHALTVSEERRKRTGAIQEFSAMLRSPDTAAVLQLLEQHAVQRMKVTECLNAHVATLNECHFDMSLLKSASVESEQRLTEQRRETLALLQTQNGILPKTEAELLRDNKNLSLQLQQTRKQMQVIQEQMNDVKSQSDASNQKHLLQLQELDVQLKENKALIQTLETKLKESEAQAKRNMTPGAAELEAIKDKLVKMELDHIAVTTSHENDIAQMSSVLEHRAEVIRKLKETLRKMQQDDEQSFLDSDEANLNVGSNTRAVTSLKEKKIEELQKKNAQFESLVSKQQEEISKWKRRAYKMKESNKDGLCTPTKRQPPLTKTEVNSPKKMFLDSPKSKFFDMRSSVPISLNCPTQFFDNSNLGTVPEVSCLPAEAVVEFSDSDEEDSSSSAAVVSHKADNKADDWWQIPNASSTEPTASVNANGCPTQ
ncbi:LOW QUALITY PROTEIN: centromere-associated protein E [Xyrauchen texanus]|uniref:LOW QUALITY PROTEIN: centromere-associated protein E n=1 Tax=Xyrauchen texanus TaxID=154827 RepID=UPI0022419A82|nr:LOW QUALITY PROTEIN: centromere-associated protein E [Xyrauchen texanus]